jgi:hypothetical protein
MLWAYVMRGPIFLPFDGIGYGYFDVHVETLVKPGLTIDPSSFRVLSFGGGLSNVSYLLLKDSKLSGTDQVWEFRAFFLPDKVCSMSLRENFTASYSLVSNGDVLTQALPPTRYNITFSLHTSENWCSVSTSTIELIGNQQGYTDSTYTVPTNKYLISGRAYIKVTINPLGLELSQVQLEIVRLSGSGIVLGPALIFNNSDSTTVDPDFACLLSVCSPALINTTCFSFALPNNRIKHMLPVTVESVLQVFLRQINRRLLSSFTQKSFQSSSRIYIDFTPQILSSGDSKNKVIVYIYSVSPVLLMCFALVALLAVLCVLLAVVLLFKFRLQSKQTSYQPL